MDKIKFNIGLNAFLMRGQPFHVNVGGGDGDTQNN